MIYRAYSIETERDGSFSLYALGNSMYDVHTGFKTMDAAKQFADSRLGPRPSNIYAADGKRLYRYGTII